jgi:Zn-dependent peptidase ImmA (M78 family)
MRFPSRIADEILDELDITNIQDLRLLEEIAFQRKAIVEVESLGTAEARLVRGEPYSVIVIAQEVRDSHRRRFGIAHELGHLELHRLEYTFPCLSDDIDDWGTQKHKLNIEQEANEFASALLLPERFFAPLCLEYEISTDTIKELANTFETSLMATGRRYVYFCEVPIAIEWTQNEQIKWFQRNEEFEDYRFFPNIHSHISEKSIAARFYNNEVLPRSPRPVQASVWMEGSSYKDVLIQEQCIPMSNLNGVLSLLWVDEDWLEEDDVL